MSEPTTDLPPDPFDPADERGSEVDDFTGDHHRPGVAADAAEAADAVAEAEAIVEHDVEALLAERDTFKDAALRLQADFENYRKRVAAQQADEVDRATGKLAAALLPVLDACEQAFVQHPAEIEPLFNLLLGELKRAGLEAMHLHDQPFDPSLAEAVLHEPGEGADGSPVVVDVLRSGYTWKGRVLRPAMVKVRG